MKIKCSKKNLGASDWTGQLKVDVLIPLSQSEDARLEIVFLLLSAGDQGVEPTTFMQ